MVIYRVVVLFIFVKVVLCFSLFRFVCIVGALFSYIDFPIEFLRCKVLLRAVNLSFSL